jgi:serine/threonine-protein kinase
MKTTGKYPIQGLLGQGGMSRVYLVLHPGDDKLAALKHFAPHPTLVNLISRERAASLFISEAKRLATLRHPHIVDIIDSDIGPPDLFYTMEYHPSNLGIVMGEYWRTEAPSRQLPVDIALRYGMQICEGIAALHNAGIVHRDLKPFNILLTDADTVKICDFGLSRIRGERFPAPPTLKVGSPYYAAPEQVNDPDAADERSDIYAAGVILFRMVTGRLPETADRGAHRINPLLTPGWTAFLARATHPDRNRRFHSIDALQAALAERQADWEADRERVCRLDPAAIAAPRLPTPDLHLRTRSRKILNLAEARPCFGLNRLWEPAHYSGADFQRRRSDIVHDAVNKRSWQQSGSITPLDFQSARRYVDRLNRIRFGGLTGWRLPTINELLTLITGPPGIDRICTPSVFDPLQNNLWSSDRRAFTSAYYVSTDMGFVAWQDRRAHCHVRAVCSR